MISEQTLQIFMEFMEKAAMLLIVGIVVTAAAMMKEDPNDI